MENTNTKELLTWEQLKDFYTPGKLMTSISKLNHNDINKLNDDGKSLLMLAIINNFSKRACEALLLAGANWCLRSPSANSDGNTVYGKNAIEYAIAYNSTRALDAILNYIENKEAIQSLYSSDFYKGELFTWAELNRLASTTIILDSIRNLKKEGQINKQDEDGKTLLMFATLCHFSWDVETLLGNGADLLITDKEDKTAINHAQDAGSVNTKNILETWLKAKDLCTK